MAKQKATGEAPKKRTSRKTPVATAEQTTQQSPETTNNEPLQMKSPGSNGGNTRTGSMSDEEIRRRAYEIWEQRGRQHGKDADDWFRAESEVRGKSA